MIRNEGLSSVNVMDMLTGKIPGTIGETSVIAILIGAMILIPVSYTHLSVYGRRTAGDLKQRERKRRYPERGSRQHGQRDQCLSLSLIHI